MEVFVRIALVINNDSPFHHILGFLDALPHFVGVDVYVPNSHDWVGLLTMHYLNELEQSFRHHVSLLHIDNFEKDDKQYDYIFQDDLLLEHLVTDKLFKSRAKYEPGKVAILAEFTEWDETSQFVVINQEQRNKIAPNIMYVNITHDQLYQTMSSCERLYDTSFDLSLTCLIPQITDTNDDLVNRRRQVIAQNREHLTNVFQYKLVRAYPHVFLDATDPFMVHIPPIFETSAKIWRDLNTTATILTFDDVVNSGVALDSVVNSAPIEGLVFNVHFVPTKSIEAWNLNTQCVNIPGVCFTLPKCEDVMELEPKWGFVRSTTNAPVLTTEAQSWQTVCYVFIGIFFAVLLLFLLTFQGWVIRSAVSHVRKWWATNSSVLSS